MLIKIIFCILIVLLLLVLAIGVGLFRFVSMPKTVSYDEKIRKCKEEDVWFDFESLEPEDMDVISSKDGYLLHGKLIINKKSDGKHFVIITHGYTDCMFNSIKYANIFMEAGYSVYMYDIRRHGANKKTFCTMSYLEKYDLLDVKDAIVSRFGQDIVLGLHGESLGCATSVSAAGMWEGFSFVVADCGFYDFSMMMEEQVENVVHMPPVVIRFADLVAKVMIKTTYSAIKPIEYAAKYSGPILFIHGGADDFINKNHSQMAYDMSPSLNKQICFFEGAGHAQSYASDRVKYRQVVLEFLRTL